MRDQRGIRINRYLAMCGLGARRAVERLVKEGRVAVDGAVVDDLAFRVPPGAAVSVGGKEVRPRRRFRYVAYNKKRGVLTTTRDPHRRRTVRDELSRQLRDLKPVGRLDGDTEGLLLLTDDGSFAHRVAHPSFGVVKKYVVVVEGRVTKKDVAALERGVELEEGHIGKVNVGSVKRSGAGSTVSVSAVYGRKRMIRQMFAVLGHKVKALRRVAVGPVKLSRLRPGEWRELTEEEVAALGVSVARDVAVVVTVDGPAGAGKSTVGMAVARRLGFSFVETGKLYRALALKALREEIPLDDGPRLAGAFERTDVRYALTDGEPLVALDGEDVTAELASGDVADAASAISALPAVREVLLPLQRRLAKPPGVVVEGRDIGTVVFPDAAYKFYLDASPGERARRRAGDFAAMGKDVAAEEVEKDLAVRDNRDAGRVAAPLRRAEDAVYVDTTAMAFEEVVDFIVECVERGEAARTAG